MKEQNEKQIDQKTERFLLFIVFDIKKYLWMGTVTPTKTGIILHHKNF
jgi:hypothetical protein